MLEIGEERLNTDHFSEVVFKNTPIDISSDSIQRVQRSFQFLCEYSKNKIIYGINTGLGPMAQYQIPDDERISLQYNAIRSHAAGMGERIPDVYVKAAMLSSLNAYLKGHSGVHPDVVVLLKELINNNIIPVVPEHGGVGASGDLVQMAHVALVLIGEGEVSYKAEILPAAEVFEKHKLKPLCIRLREGLSLINGTYMMTGTGIVNLILAKRLLQWSTLASAMINEIVESFDDYFSEELNRVKQHDGQQEIARQIRELLNGSSRIRSRKDYLFGNIFEDEYIKDKVQEYYSVRCVPQILGPVYDTLENATKTLLNEANSTSDNPVIDLESMSIFHGGNFHGEYVASEMDKLKTSVVKLSMLCERQLNFLLNSKLNQKLSPFVNMGKLGVNFGMQGTQFTATSTVAENQTLAFPMSVHSISCNNDNQDIVSMGTNAALLTKKVIDNAFQVMAIQAMAIAQAIDYLEIKEEIADASQGFYKSIRNLSPAFQKDAIRYKELKAIKDFLIDNNIEDIKL